MTTLRAPFAYAIAAVVGAVGWLGISQLTHRREAWDSDLYFSWFLPSVAVVVAGLAFFAPERSWRWAFTPFGAQAAVATVQNPGANLLPLGLLVFAFYGALCLIPARLGVALRRRLATALLTGAGLRAGGESARMPVPNKSACSWRALQFKGS